MNVEIMVQNLNLSSDGDDEWLKALAATVDEKINSIRAKRSPANSVSLAILAALNFAEELERLKKEHQALIDGIGALNRKLSMAI